MGQEGQWDRRDSGTVSSATSCRAREEGTSFSNLSDSWSIIPGGGGETESVVPEDTLGEGT